MIDVMAQGADPDQHPQPSFCHWIFQALVIHVPDIIRTIIGWTIDYLRDHVINWIREQGGWVRGRKKKNLNEIKCPMEERF